MVLYLETELLMSVHEPELPTRRSNLYFVTPGSLFQLKLMELSESVVLVNPVGAGGGHKLVFAVAVMVFPHSAEYVVPLPYPLIRKVYDVLHVRFRTV